MWRRIEAEARRRHGSSLRRAPSGRILLTDCPGEGGVPEAPGFTVGEAVLDLSRTLL